MKYVSVALVTAMILFQAGCLRAEPRPVTTEATPPPQAPPPEPPPQPVDMELVARTPRCNAYAARGPDGNIFYVVEETGIGYGHCGIAGR